jgi:hypothetical protein
MCVAYKKFFRVTGGFLQLFCCSKAFPNGLKGGLIKGCTDLLGNLEKQGKPELKPWMK